MDLSCKDLSVKFLFVYTNLPKKKNRQMTYPFVDFVPNNYELLVLEITAKTITFLIHRVKFMY